MGTRAVVTDPIDNNDMRDVGDFTELWAEMGVEFLAKIEKSDDPDQWVNLSLTIGGNSFAMNRTIALDD